MTKFSFNLKKKIIEEYFSTGIGSTSLAKKYNINSRSSVLNWIHMYNAFGIKGLVVRHPIKVYSG